MSNFTAQDKLEAVRRELGYRRRVYERKIGNGTMTRDHANHQIAVFEAIEADYVKAAQSELLL